jgi:hypothetical protein
MHAGYLWGTLYLVVAPTIAAQSFCEKDVYIGNDFFADWTWLTINDPTNGRVNYVDQTTAINTGLSYGTFTPALYIESAVY